MGIYCFSALALGADFPHRYPWEVTDAAIQAEEQRWRDAMAGSKEAAGNAAPV